MKSAYLLAALVALLISLPIHGIYAQSGSAPSRLLEQFNERAVRKADDLNVGKATTNAIQNSGQHFDNAGNSLNTTRIQENGMARAMRESQERAQREAQDAQRLADQKKIDDKRIADQRAAEQKAADQKRLNDQQLTNKKAFEQKQLNGQQATDVKQVLERVPVTANPTVARQELGKRFYDLPPSKAKEELGAAIYKAEQKAPKTDKTGFTRGGPPRDAAGNYLPLPDAVGAHTTIGTRIGRDGKPYRQGATFDKDGKFIGRTDVTNHGRVDHDNPHFHPATGPASVKKGSHPIPK